MAARSVQERSAERRSSGRGAAADRWRRLDDGCSKARNMARSPGWPDAEDGPEGRDCAGAAASCSAEPSSSAGRAAGGGDEPDHGVLLSAAASRAQESGSGSDGAGNAARQSDRRPERGHRARAWSPCRRGCSPQASPKQLHQRRRAFEGEVDRILRRGVISAEEGDRLKEIRDRLGLTDHQAAEITRLMAQRHDALQCPHCGRSWSPADRAPGDPGAGRHAE